ncbi:hypothetical protein IFM89_013307 [Coptis chinensis]|uniref:Uncharacterized protein n=1 Tax=Coptis chinensis TaxID=261450 RepID=A0A835HCV4_9MAGN|nr:hypothetical protein IFM89_013307 [Coptis chinensis]
MLPEIQTTVKQPVVGNMMKALYFQFTIGVIPMSHQHIPSHIHPCKSPDSEKEQVDDSAKSWHWLNVFVFACMSFAAAVAALRLIAVDSKTYHLFADL